MFQIVIQEAHNLAPRNKIAIAAIVEVAVSGSGNNEQPLVGGILAACEFLVGFLAEIAAVSLLAMNY